MAYWLLNGGVAMINALFIQPGYEAAKKMLDVTALRHEAIASNIANLETPHYKRIDIAPSFDSEFQQALSSGDAARMNAIQPSVAVDEKAVACGPDGNTVSLEGELLELNQNTMAHTLETQVVSSQLMKLRLAISGHS